MMEMEMNKKKTHKSVKFVLTQFTLYVITEEKAVLYFDIIRSISHSLLYFCLQWKAELIRKYHTNVYFTFAEFRAKAKM